MALILASEVLEDLGITSPTAAQTNIVNRAVTRAIGNLKQYIGYDPEQGTRTEEYYPNRDLNINNRETVAEISGNQAIMRRVSSAATDKLQVRHIPIRSITSLFIDYGARSGTQTGAFGASSEQTEGVDFWPNYEQTDSLGSKVCLDGIIKSEGLWPTESGSVKLTYVSGYTAAELAGTDAAIDASPIRSAALSEACRQAKTVFLNAGATLSGTTVGFTSGTITSERMGDYSYNISNSSGSRGSTSDRLYGGSTQLTSESQQMLADFVNWGWRLRGT